MDYKDYKITAPKYEDLKDIKPMQDTLATELLREVKAGAKRWFIAFIVVLCLWFATIGVFIWYISLPVEEYSIDQSADDNSSNMVVGGNNYGSQTENKLQEESSSE